LTITILLQTHFDGHLKEIEFLKEEKSAIIKLLVNDEFYALEKGIRVQPWHTLAHTLRETLGFTVFTTIMPTIDNV
jgi:hypothetical protein